jgi:hypothetical protein
VSNPYAQTVASPPQDDAQQRLAQTHPSVAAATSPAKPMMIAIAAWLFAAVVLMAIGVLVASFLSK